LKGIYSVHRSDQDVGGTSVMTSVSQRLLDNVEEGRALTAAQPVLGKIAQIETHNDVELPLTFEDEAVYFLAYAGVLP
jgi:hypothetical protein